MVWMTPCSNWMLLICSRMLLVCNRVLLVCTRMLLIDSYVVCSFRNDRLRQSLCKLEISIIIMNMIITITRWPCGDCGSRNLSYLTIIAFENTWDPLEGYFSILTVKHSQPLQESWKISVLFSPLWDQSLAGDVFKGTSSITSVKSTPLSYERD